MITTVTGTQRTELPDDRSIQILDLTGDTKQTWNPNNTDEVDAARELFNKLRKKGYICFSVAEDGGKKEQINEFNPTLGKMIMSPAMVGG